MPYPYYNFQYGQNLPQQAQPQVTQSPLVMVRSEMEARNYPVAYGNNVLFKDETAPYVYSKTMGFSQLDKPVFERYRLVKEETQEEKPPVEFDYRAEIESIWNEINLLKERRNEYPKSVPTIHAESNGNVKPKIQHSNESKQSK